ncbi:hypothetical protein [Aquimarina macrocephali]|uniref:hypothetical protein n=1 Tax=Aquimarina macrocephali TaxID=666563 RepID=UPI003F68050F
MLLDLNRENESFQDGPWEVSIKHYVHGKEGGVVLDVTGFADDYICTGHGVINEGGVYKPQPIDGTKQALLVGVVRSTTRKEKPSTGVMTQGTINNNAVKYPFNTAALVVLKANGIYNQVD